MGSLGGRMDGEIQMSRQDWHSGYCESSRLHFPGGEQRRHERIGDKFNQLCHNSWAMSSLNINLRRGQKLSIQVEVEVRNILFFYHTEKAWRRLHHSQLVHVFNLFLFSILAKKNCISVILYFLSVANSNPCISGRQERALPTLPSSCSQRPIL